MSELLKVKKEMLDKKREEYKNFLIEIKVLEDAVKEKTKKAIEVVNSIGKMLNIGDKVIYKGLEAKVHALIVGNGGIRVDVSLNEVNSVTKQVVEYDELEWVGK